MKCLLYFGITSMKEDTSVQLSGRGELHGRLRVRTLVTLRKCTSNFKRKTKVIQLVSTLTKAFRGGSAWIKSPKKDMAVTFPYFALAHSIGWFSRYLWHHFNGP